MVLRSDRTEDVRYTHVALDPPFDIIRARYVRHQFARHAHPEYAIGVVEHGTGLLQGPRGLDEHPTGSIIAIPPGLAHSGCAADDEGLSYRMLYLPVSWLERAAARAGFPAGARPWFARVVLHDDELADRIIAVHAALEEAHTAPQAQAERLAGVLHDLVRRHAEIWSEEAGGEAPPTPELQAVRAFLDAGFTRPVTIDEMSRVAGLNPFYLIHAFRRAYGLPPYTYVEQLRVQRARQLIEAGASIVEAALQSGFSDQSHLTRRFKRTLGITPGVIARRSQRTARSRPPARQGPRRS